MTAVEPGTYTITTALGGRTCTRPAGCTRTITVVSGETSAAQDFGGYHPATASGTVHDDLDGDGTVDAGEPGAALGVVWADLDDDGTRDADEPDATVAADGSWSIDGLAPGLARFRLASGSRQSSASGTPAACDGDHSLIVRRAESEIDLAAYRTASIAGTVSGPDGPLGGRTAYLDLDGDGERSTTASPRTTTVDDGTYASPA